MRVLFVSSEVHPLAKTGGLADVSEALPKALRAHDVDVRLLMPAYPQAKDRLMAQGAPIALKNVLGFDDVALIPGLLPGSELPIWLIDCPLLYDRPGRLYCDPDGQEWHDNALRYALLSHVVARLARGLTPLAWRPDIVHANDWHTGIIPALLDADTAPRPAVVFTIHNMAYQGNFPAACLDFIGLSSRLYHPDGVEFHNRVSFLKAGVRYADRITTVSPTYASEILSPDFGHGLEGVARQRQNDLVGILNGADYGLWDPVNDRHLIERYDRHYISGKKICKAALLTELGLPAMGNAPLIAFNSRLVEQKMADVVLEAVPAMVAAGGQFALLGEGDRRFESAFADLARRYPESISVRIGYDEPAAHRLLAGADILLAPARFEPCGLTQLYAMRYGTVPIVRRTGGLADTVVDATPETLHAGAATGLSFHDISAAALGEAARRAIELFGQPLLWRRLQVAGMQADFSWERSARRYLDLYRSLRPESQLRRVARGRTPDDDDSYGGRVVNSR
ncbi:MAG: glycogen synthase GlgA [Sphingomonadales bacterium]|nr:glycogen synthase GlgA [Sphingomonadales bacterium]